MRNNAIGLPKNADSRASLENNSESVGSPTGVLHQNLVVSASK